MATDMQQLATELGLSNDQLASLQRQLKALAALCDAATALREETGFAAHLTSKWMLPPAVGGNRSAPLLETVGLRDLKGKKPIAARTHEEIFNLPNKESETLAHYAGLFCEKYANKQPSDETIARLVQKTIPVADTDKEPHDFAKALHDFSFISGMQTELVKLELTDPLRKELNHAIDLAGTKKEQIATLIGNILADAAVDRVVKFQDSSAAYNGLRPQADTLSENLKAFHTVCAAVLAVQKGEISFEEYQKLTAEICKTLPVSNDVDDHESRAHNLVIHLSRITSAERLEDIKPEDLWVSQYSRTLSDAQARDILHHEAERLEGIYGEDFPILSEGHELFPEERHARFILMELHAVQMCDVAINHNAVRAAMLATYKPGNPEFEQGYSDDIRQALLELRGLMAHQSATDSAKNYHAAELWAGYHNQVAKLAELAVAENPIRLTPEAVLGNSGPRPDGEVFAFVPDRIRNRFEMRTGDNKADYPIGDGHKVFDLNENPLSAAVDLSLHSENGPEASPPATGAVIAPDVEARFYAAGAFPNLRQGLKKPSAAQPRTYNVDPEIAAQLAAIEGDKGAPPVAAAPVAAPHDPFADFDHAAIDHQLQQTPPAAPIAASGVAEATPNAVGEGKGEVDFMAQIRAAAGDIPAGSTWAGRVDASGGVEVGRGGHGPSRDAGVPLSAAFADRFTPGDIT